jgi:molecular chaperone GrpE
MAANKKIKIEGGEEEKKPDAAGPPEGDVAAEDTENQAAEDTAEETPKSEIEILKEQLEAVTQESEANKDKFMRASADLENYKKRSAREMDDMRKYANQSLVKDLLPVLDNLELALKSARENDNAAEHLVDGVELIRKDIIKIFDKFNIEQIDALGKAFDPRFHEAVMREETSKYSENTVINELQKGYLMHDRLIRPSMVVVAMPKNQQSDQKEDSSTN